MTEEEQQVRGFYETVADVEAEDFDGRSWEELGPAEKEHWTLRYRDLEVIVPAHDPVDHPSHYTSGPKCDNCGKTIECINITRHLPFNPGNAIKYLWRRYFGGKAGEDQIEPVAKARFYLNDEVGRLEGLAKEGDR